MWKKLENLALEAQLHLMLIRVNINRMGFWNKRQQLNKIRIKMLNNLIKVFHSKVKRVMILAHLNKINCKLN